MIVVNKCFATVLGLLVLILSQTTPVFADVYSSVTNAKNAVQSAPLSSFKNAEIKPAYLNDLEGVNLTLVIAGDETESTSKNQLYQDALNTVNNLISKTDGCVTNGVPDSEDWIVDCTDSSQVHAALAQLSSDINALIQ